jgi:uncharacterized protein YdeI (YjbR/CyaY-like superfamily)
MIEKIEEWQARANTTGQMGIAIHLEEMSEWLDTIKLSEHSADLLRNFIRDNLSELSKEIRNKRLTVEITNRKEFLDAVADQIVTATAAGGCNGMKVAKAVEEVNRSNWSKFLDGQPLYDAGGKVIKGPAYTPPNLTGMF